LSQEEAVVVWLSIETFLAGQAGNRTAGYAMTINREAAMRRQLPEVVNPATGIRLFAAASCQTFLGEGFGLFVQIPECAQTRGQELKPFSVEL